MSGIDAPTASATAALVGLLVLTATAAPAVAATDTPVRLVGADESTTVGETTTVDVVVGNVDGGVGAYDLTVAVDDPDVATVVDAAVAGDSGARDVEVAPDGSNASVRAAMLDTDDAGEVTVATVTVAGQSAGSADLTVSVEALGDEEGRAYAVTAERGTSVTVTDDDGSTDRSNDDAAGEPTDGSDGDGTDASDSGSGAESGSSPDSAATETASAPAGQSGGTGADAGDDDSERGAPVEVSGFGSLLSPATAAFVLFAGLALLGGAVHLRRPR